MQLNEILIEHKKLRSQIRRALNSVDTSANRSSDFIITHCEINHKHGIGILLKRIFADSKNKFIIRSKNLYGGENDFSDLHSYALVEQVNLSRAEIISRVKTAIKSSVPRHVISLPYYPDDVLTTLALDDLFDAPLCTYIMDDQNFLVNNIPDDLLEELINKSDLCLGISQELCQAYESKFNRKFWWLPPVVPPHLINGLTTAIDPKVLATKKGILIGNIWSQKWLDRLRTLTKITNYPIDWYGNPDRSWIIFDERELLQDGINLKNYLPEEQLSEILSLAPYSVIPTGSTEELEDRPEIAKLSLPSRLLFILAAAHTPVIVIGSKDTAVARFVESFEIGYVCDYDPESFREVVEKICSPDVQERIRRQATSLAKSFSSEGIENWIWRSLSLSKPADFRFEKLRGVMEDATVVITANEVTQKHGTGALVKRILGETPDIFSIRSLNHYNGDHDLGEVSVLLSIKGLTRAEAYRKILDAFKGSTVRRVFCVPYYPEELILAIAIEELFKVPLATYIMDDQNIGVNEIPDDLMKEFLNKCNLRLATHPELRDAYEAKYGLKFWLLPAIVPDRLVCEDGDRSIDYQYLSPQKGALIGSLWSQKWCEMLCDTIYKAGISLDWFGNPTYFWMSNPKESLRAYGVNVFGLLPEHQLADNLKNYPYVIVPTGTLDDRDDRSELSRLSLPGRIILAMATSNTPVIILGDEKTSAAKFVARFGIGLTCDYDAGSLRTTVEHITRPDIQREFRQNAARVAREFSAKGIEEWLWRSIERGQPISTRFEKLFPRSPVDSIAFIEPPIPENIPREYTRVYAVARKLSGRGFTPDFVVEVGGSDSSWSYTISEIFNKARIILIDPLASKYERETKERFLTRKRRVEFWDLAVADHSGRTSNLVSRGLTKTSSLAPLEVTTLDDIFHEKKINGRGILKLDARFVQRIVFEGAGKFLEKIDAIFVGLNIAKQELPYMNSWDILQFMENSGFQYHDDSSEKRSPVDGTLLQKEILFLRKCLFIPATCRNI